MAISRNPDMSFDKMGIQEIPDESKRKVGLVIVARAFFVFVSFSDED